MANALGELFGDIANGWKYFGEPCELQFRRIR